MNGQKSPHVGLRSSKPKILFVYESTHPIVVKDGLWAALELLRDTFDIKKINMSTDHELKSTPDFVLAWGAFGSKSCEFVRHLPSPKGLCIAGNAIPPTNAKDFDVVFYETDWYHKQLDHPNKIRAFGINTDIYKKLGLKRNIDYLGVGAYALWKRWNKMVDKKGKRVVVGEFQEGNKEESRFIWDILTMGGVECMRMVTPEELAKLYNRAKTVYIPADINGGGERAVWEAIACGCKVEVEEDNPKLKSLASNKTIWDHHRYAEMLRMGINTCL